MAHRVRDRNLRVWQAAHSEGLTRSDLEKLRNDLVGKTVTFKYPRYWTPLSLISTARHVSKVQHGETAIFDETK